MEIYTNPEHIPLEKLKLNVRNDGVVVAINALDAKWADKRYLLRYEVPEIYNNDGSEIMGAKEHWIEVVTYIIEDLNWLLDLPFYRFWSNIVYNTSIIDTLVSFLQEAPPFYALEDFPPIPEMLEALEKLRRNILIVFVRLVTREESLTEFMNRIFFGNLLYDNYIFTIPIIFDLCQLYGRENAEVIGKIVHNIFSLQPSYNDDLEKSVPCLIKALKNVEQRFEDRPVNINEMGASDREDGFAEMTLCNLEDLILYILDLSSTVAILLKSYSPAIVIFHKEDFMNELLSIYGNAIPEMYKKLDKLAYNDESMPKYIELKHRLDVTRVEILNLYRIIVYEPILNIQKEINVIDNDIRNYIEEYLDLLTNAISEKEFIIDYHQFYPINHDLEIISKLYPEIDVIKCNYILKSLYASTGGIETSANTFLGNITVTTVETSDIRNNRQKEHCNDTNYIIDKLEPASKNPDGLMCRVSEVREILCDCGEGFIQLCLKHYNNNVASVVNAVLEDDLPPNLKELDKTLPYIPPDSMELSAAVDSAIGVERLNVFDNDEFDIMTRDIIDTSRIHRGKKKEKYKDANEMLNDKSDVKKFKDIYQKYSVVADYVDDYCDEYDDTYDNHVFRGNACTDDPTEIDARSFVTPRVLCASDKNDSEDDAEVEEEKPVLNNTCFLQDPAEMRARSDREKNSTRGGRNAHSTGKVRERGQDKDVSVNRHKKNAHKSWQSNHNRRIGSQIKRRQGMIPS